MQFDVMLDVVRRRFTCADNDLVVIRFSDRALAPTELPREETVPRCKSPVWLVRIAYELRHTQLLLRFWRKPSLGRRGVQMCSRMGSTEETTPDVKHAFQLRIERRIAKKRVARRHAHRPIENRI